MKTKNLELYISLITLRLTIKVKLLNRNALLKNSKQFIKKNKIKKILTMPFYLTEGQGLLNERCLQIYEFHYINSFNNASQQLLS